MIEREAIDESASEYALRLQLSYTFLLKVVT